MCPLVISAHIEVLSLASGCDQQGITTQRESDKPLLFLSDICSDSLQENLIMSLFSGDSTLFFTDSPGETDTEGLKKLES